MKYVHIILIAVFLVMATLLTSSTGQEDTPDVSYQLLYAHEGDIWVADAQGQHPHQVADGKPLDPWAYPYQSPIFHHPVYIPAQEDVFFYQWFADELWTASLNEENGITRFSDIVVAPYFGLALSPDRLLLGSVTPESDTIARFQAISLVDGNITISVPFSFNGGCGGQTNLPDEFLYTMQAGFMGNDLILEWVGNTIILSSSCNGIGIQLLNLDTGITSPLSLEMKRASLSPNQKLLAGIVDTRLQIVDIETQTPLYTLDNYPYIDQLTWEDDTHLIISTVKPDTRLTLAPKDIQLASRLFFDNPPASIQTYQVELFRVHIPSMEATQLWSSNKSRGVVSLVAADGWLYFSSIHNLRALVKALNDGVSTEEVLVSYPESDVYRLSLASNSNAEIIIRGGESPTILDFK